VFFNGFDWDDVNIEHVARHGVTPSEAEQAVEDNNFLYYRIDESRYLGYGRTSASGYLVVVFVWRPKHIIRFVTARRMTDSERRRFSRRR
jgi:hypothetical protein